LSGLTPNTRPTPAAGGLTAYDYSVHADTLGTAPPSATTEVVPVTTVRLAPLTENQIRQLTVHHKVANANAFIAALSRTGGLFLAGRPRDLEWLAEQWNREQRFGSLWEMLDRNVWAKLQERNPALGDRDRLTPERALHAAERLAGATILCRESLIRIPDPHLDPSVDHPALDPAEVLDKWAPADIAALLRRPLFEEAPGGRVRFHHTTTQAFLAGRWLLHLLEEECPPHAVLDLMLRESYGARRPITSMREVAGWVACKDADVRRELLNVAPEWVLLGGDAEQIPVEDRAKSLRALARVYRAETRFPWIAEDSDIARLADPALDSVVQGMLKDSATSGAVGSFLLDIARVGRLPMSAEMALTFAVDATQEHRVRLAAVSAVGAADDTALRSQLFSYALSEATPDNRFLARVGLALFPNTLTVGQLTELLHKFEPVPIESFANISYVVAWRWVEQCPAAALDELLEHLVGLATTPPYDQSLICRRFDGHLR
jgi:hypothetical protein